MFREDGVFVRNFSNRRTEFGGFPNPVALAVSHKKHVFVCDRQNHRVDVFTTRGQLLRTWGRKSHGYGGHNGYGEFYKLRVVAVTREAQMRVFVSDDEHVQAFTETGDYLFLIDAYRVKSMSVGCEGIAMRGVLGCELYDTNGVLLKNVNDLAQRGMVHKDSELQRLHTYCLAIRRSLIVFSAENEWILCWRSGKCDLFSPDFREFRGFRGFPANTSKHKFLVLQSGKVVLLAWNREELDSSWIQYCENTNAATTHVLQAEEDHTIIHRTHAKCGNVRGEEDEPKFQSFYE